MPPLSPVTSTRRLPRGAAGLGPSSAPRPLTTGALLPASVIRGDRAGGSASCGGGAPGSGVARAAACTSGGRKRQALQELLEQVRQ